MMNRLAGQLLRGTKHRLFNSARYWDRRYRSGGNSGAGSYNHLADFKALTLNEFVQKNKVKSIIEFGCGDGNQLRLSKYPSYTGYDVSDKAVELCKATFGEDKTKAFKTVSDWRGEKADLALSLDVIFHLVEDKVFEEYMSRLFESSTKHVVIYSSNFESGREIDAPHVRHREFTRWIADHAPRWTLQRHVPNMYPISEYGPDGSFADFYFFQITTRDRLV